MNGINVTSGEVVIGTYTASTISFTASDTISDSAAGFLAIGLAVGDGIQVTGAANAENNTNFVVVTVAAGTITVSPAFDGIITLTTEAAGASVTIDRGVALTLTKDQVYPVVIASGDTTDLRALGLKASDIATDTVLGAAIDSGDVTMNVDGEDVTSSTQLTKVGSGIGGAESLAATLVVGNTSGGTAIQMSTTDQVQFGGTVNYLANGATGILEGTSNKGFKFTGPGSIFTTGTTTTELEDVANPGYKFTFSQQMATGGRINYIEPTQQGVLEFNQITATRTWTLPDATGTVALTSDLSAYQLTSEKGSANGYASLDGSGKIPTSELPVQMMEFEGNWDASTNTPTLANTDTGKQGTVYRTSVAGTVDFGAGNVTFAVGDWVYNTGSVWELGEQSAQVLPIASETVQGIAEIATQAETDAGTDDTRIVTPLKLAAYAGSQSIKRVAVADAAASIAAGDTITAYTSITVTRIATLPTAASVTVGEEYTIKDESGSVTGAINITVDGNGAETINGLASVNITAAYGGLTVYSNGTAWFTK
jgi:hypothetical protein